MTAKVIDGKAFAANVRAQVADHVARLKADHGITPGLAVVLVGEDPASKVYVANKAKQTVEVGMNSWEHKLPADTSEADLLALVTKLNNDPSVIVGLRERLHRALRNNLQVFGKHAFRKSRPTTQARSIINASLFDVMSTLLASIDEEIVRVHADALRHLFAGVRLA